MKALVLAAFLAFLAPASASAQSEPLTAAVLLEACRGGDEVLTLFCFGYLQGANDILRLTLSALAPDRYCPPAAGLPNETLRSVVVGWLTTHPPARDDTARTAVAEALMATYPCD